MPINVEAVIMRALAYEADARYQSAAAFEEALAVARDCKADLVLGNDPDCDRLGIAARDSNGEYRLVTGTITLPAGM